MVPSGSSACSSPSFVFSFLVLLLWFTGLLQLRVVLSSRSGSSSLLSALGLVLFYLPSLIRLFPDFFGLSLLFLIRSRWPLCWHSRLLLLLLSSFLPFFFWGFLSRPSPGSPLLLAFFFWLFFSPPFGSCVFSGVVGWLSLVPSVPAFVVGLGSVFVLLSSLVCFAFVVLLRLFLFPFCCFLFLCV